MLETATLIPGTEIPIGDGYTNAMRCAISPQSGGRIAAVIKRLPRQAVFAEAFSALLLRAWGLSVPTPYLVDEAGRLSFASADGHYPSLKQRMGLHKLPSDHPAYDALICAAGAIAAALPETPLALAADEAIDNRDRNLGNILWDGQDATWIDHELSLGLATHLPDCNKLAQMVAAHGDGHACQRSAMASWLTGMDRDAPAQACAQCGAEAAPMANIVAQRLTALGSRIIARFPAPDDLLSRA